MEKVKDLEKSIQAYIDSHTDSEVRLEVTREIDFSTEPHRQSSMTWKVTVTHPPTELP